MRLTDHLDTYVENSLIMQVATHNGMSQSDILTPGDDGLVINEDLSAEIVANLSEAGINADATAEHIVLALRLLLTDHNNSDVFHRQIATVTWNVLGNPRETSTPPEIYLRAARQVWALICHMI